MENFAVITGDIINFTKLDSLKRQKLIRDTQQLLKSWVEKASDAQIFRGDSYQLIIGDINDAILKSIRLICWFKKHSDTVNNVHLSCRISVGIGTVAYKGKTVLDSDGDAFHRSGRRFDKMSAGEILTIQTGNKEINRQVTIILNFINIFLNQWTPNQAEVVYLACEGYTQSKMAEKLNLDQAAVNRRLKAARWKEVEKGILYISQLVTN
jgi:hypothetical protein